MFDAWLHEAGYAYMGDRSIYKLTIPEMARLRRGFNQRSEERRPDDGGQRSTAQPGPTPGDLKTVEAFEREHLN